MCAVRTTIRLSGSHSSAWVSPASRSRSLPSATPRLTRSAGDLFRQLPNRGARRRRGGRDLNPSARRLAAHARDAESDQRRPPKPDGRQIRTVQPQRCDRFRWSSDHGRADVGRRLGAASFRVAAFDIDAGARERAATTASVDTMPSVSQIATGAGAVILILPNSSVVRQVALDDRSLEEMEPV